VVVKWSYGRYGILNMGLSMRSMKTLKPEDMEKHQNKIEGVDIPFGPPPEQYSYRCSRCKYEMEVNEAIIEVGIAKAEFEGTYFEGFMPILVCPNCNQETMEYFEA
jgi:rubrerythrin